MIIFFYSFLLFFSFSRGAIFDYGFHRWLSREHMKVEFWDPPISINLDEVGNENQYVMFYGSDSERPLEYSCGNACNILLDTSFSNERSAVVRASVSVIAPPPASAGVLQLCIGPHNLFWKRPLIAKDSTVACIGWDRSSSPKRKGGYLIYPNSIVEESSNLEVYTWYMTKKNYEEMRRNSFTRVVVPVFDEVYWLPIITTFYYKKGKVKCYFKSPFHTEKVADKPKRNTVYSHLYKYTNYVKALEENSGVYIVTCNATNWDDFVSKDWPAELSTSMHITFIKGPKIIVDGQLSSTVLLSPRNFLNISVYSTSPISTFEVERTDGVSEEGGSLIVTQTRAHNTYSIVSEYSVEVPAAVEGMSGTYTLTVINKDQESVTENLNVIKPRDLKLVVSPAEVMVAGEGDEVSVECIVIGERIKDIKWRRDFMPIKDDEALLEEILHGKEKGLKLTLFSVKLEDSGKYVCTATDQYNTRRASLSLAVWPAGSSLIMDSQSSSWFIPSYHNNHTLDINEDELELEFEWEYGFNTFSKSSIILATITFLLSTAFLICCMLAGGFYIKQLLSSNWEGLDLSKKQAAVEMTSKELWDKMRKQSVQMDSLSNSKMRELNSMGNPEQKDKRVDRIYKDTPTKDYFSMEYFDEPADQQASAVKYSEIQRVKDQQLSKDIHTEFKKVKDKPSKPEREVKRIKDDKERRKKKERDSKKDRERSEPKKDRERSEPKKDRERPEPKKDRERPEPKKDRERSEPKKDRERSKPKKDRERSEPKKDRERLEPKDREQLNSKKKDRERSKERSKSEDPKKKDRERSKERSKSERERTPERGRKSDKRKHH